MSISALCRSLLCLTLLIACPGMAAEQGRAIPAAVMEESPAQNAFAIAVFAGGCFWGMQGAFQHTTGVINAVSGYAGGGPESAKYLLVGRGNTGHAEAVQVT